jgi:uncharacterized membrane protein YesL
MQFYPENFQSRFLSENIKFKIYKPLILFIVYIVYIVSHTKGETLAEVVRIWDAEKDILV